MSFLQPSPLAFHGRAPEKEERRDSVTRSSAAAGGNAALRRAGEASSDAGLVSRLVRLVRDPVGIVGDLTEGLWDSLDLESKADSVVAEKRRQALRVGLKNASTYDDWRSWAAELDVLEGHEIWKGESDSAEYDVELVQSRLQQLDAARAACDVERMLFLVRTSLTRGLGDMGNVRLYRHSHVGTKTLIERYINAALETLRTILSLSARGAYKAMDTRRMLEQVLSARQAFGRSAMLLSGGAMLGLNHIGVLKALWEVRLLPRIISGASAGSIVAAVLCTRTDEEIPELLREFPYRNLSVFDRGDDGVLRRLARFLKMGAVLEISHLCEALQDYLGDMTFQEAYNRTRRILNICVSSASVYELPRLLNYVTAPNVLIWSAVAASCSVPLLFTPATILTKDPKTGQAGPWNPSPQHFVDGSVENDLPMTRLAEMFNVNHFIVSQVNPHVIPFLARDDDVIMTDHEPKVGAGPGWVYSAMDLAKAEAMHRMHVLAELGIFPNALTKARSVLSQKYSGDITIVPEISYADFPRLLQNPTPEFIQQAMLTGERATWPKLSRVRNHCAIELALDDAVQQLRARVVFSPSQVDLRRLHTLQGAMTPTIAEPKRASSKMASAKNRRHRRRPASMLDEPEKYDDNDDNNDDDGWMMVTAPPRPRSPYRLGVGQGQPSHPAAAFQSVMRSNSRGRGAALPTPSFQVPPESLDPITSTTETSFSPPSYSSSHVDDEDDDYNVLSASSSPSSPNSPPPPASSSSYFPEYIRGGGGGGQQAKDRGGMKSPPLFPYASQPATPNPSAGTAGKTWPKGSMMAHEDAALESSSTSTITQLPRTSKHTMNTNAANHPTTYNNNSNLSHSYPRLLPPSGSTGAPGVSAAATQSMQSMPNRTPSIRHHHQAPSSLSAAAASVSGAGVSGGGVSAPAPAQSSSTSATRSNSNRHRPGSSETRLKRIFHRTVKPRHAAAAS